MSRSDPPRLPEASEQTTGVVHYVDDTRSLQGGVLLVARYDRTEKFITTTAVQHMTHSAADAMKEVARYTHAVPAEEETKRARQETVRHAMVCAVVLAAIYACVVQTAAAPYMVGLVTVLSGVYYIGSRKAAQDKKLLEPKRDEQSK